MAEADEVVADFADSLRDLMINDKHQIQNLTLIAKEYTEYAPSISQALQHHIKTIQPARKLPALYVLDSIAKNVGSPYTIYLGANLYSTFMEAYSMVDGQTRKAMEAMLRTWKEPVQGSMDINPVFTSEQVRPIENALMKLRAVTMPRQPQPYGFTATPPQQYGHFQPPGMMPPQQQHYQQPYQYQAPPQPQQQVMHHDVENLKRELSALMHRLETEVSSDPYSYNSSILQNKLKALHDLRTILHTQQLGPAEFGMIARQIHEMSLTAVSANAVRPQPTPPVAAALPQWQQPQIQAQGGYNYQQANTSVAIAAPPAIPPTQLNDLAALLSHVQKPSTPQVRAAVPSLQDAPHAQVHAIQAQAAALPASNGSDLLASLTKAGLMKSASTPQPQPANPVQANLAALLGSLSKAVPTTKPAQKIDLMTRASLETFRPELVQQLYTDLPNQCPQCGRRFADTELGNKQKNLHLDWHFRINQRMADSARGHHRNWFVNEVDWIKLVEFDESTATAESVAIQAAAKDTSSKAKPYVRAPAGVTKVVCSICYEEMRSSYLEEIQDWAFVDAVMNGGKIVHASCLAEMQQGVQVSPQVASGPTQQPQQQQQSLAAALAALSNVAGNRDTSKTPDSALGKRKAQDQAGGMEKILKES